MLATRGIMSAQEARELSYAKIVAQERANLEATIRKFAYNFDLQIQINGEDYPHISLEKEFARLNVKATHNCQKRYDVDLTTSVSPSDKTWMGEVVRYVKSISNVILSSVEAHIQAAAKNNKTSCVFSPDANQQGKNFGWLRRELVNSGYQAGFNDGGDIIISWEKED